MFQLHSSYVIFNKNWENSPLWSSVTKMWDNSYVAKRGFHPAMASRTAPAFATWGSQPAHRGPKLKVLFINQQWNRFESCTRKRGKKEQCFAFLSRHAHCIEVLQQNKYLAFRQQILLSVKASNLTGTKGGSPLTLFSLPWIPVPHFLAHLCASGGFSP